MRFMPAKGIALTKKRRMRNTWSTFLSPSLTSRLVRKPRCSRWFFSFAFRKTVKLKIRRYFVLWHTGNCTAGIIRHNPALAFKICRVKFIPSCCTRDFIGWETSRDELKTVLSIRSEYECRPMCVFHRKNNLLKFHHKPCTNLDVFSRVCKPIKYQLEFDTVTVNVTVLYLIVSRLPLPKPEFCEFQLGNCLLNR